MTIHFYFLNVNETKYQSVGEGIIVYQLLAYKTAE